MNQTNLFDTPAPAAHGSSTSQEAARVGDKGGLHGTIQGRVYEALNYYRRYPYRNYGLGMTDEELSTVVTGCRYTSVVSARNSLCEAGLVKHSGRTRRSPTTGMPCTIWRCVR